MATRIVIPECLRTPETLQERVRREHHVLDLLNATIFSSRDCRNILHDTFGSLRLPGTRLSRDDDTLILAIRVHVVICRFCDTKDVRRDLKTVFAFVLLEYFVRIDTQV